MDVTPPMNATTLTGLEPGAEASISYDRGDSNVVVLWHAAHVRIVDGIVVAAPTPPSRRDPGPAEVLSSAG